MRALEKALTAKYETTVEESFDVAHSLLHSHLKATSQTIVAILNHPAIPRISVNIALMSSIQARTLETNPSLLL